MIARTLLELRELVQTRASVEYAPGRHLPEVIDQEINLAIVRLRSEVTNNGGRLYLSTDTGTLSTTPATGRHYGTLTFPSDAEQIVSLDIQVAGALVTLEPVSMEARLDYGDQSGEPEAWAVDDFGGYTLAIFPLPASAYPFVLTYQTQHTDLSADDDTFICLPGFEQFIVWETCLQIAIRDGLSNLEQSATRSRDRALVLALESAANFQRKTHVKTRRRVLTREQRWRMQ